MTLQKDLGFSQMRLGDWDFGFNQCSPESCPAQTPLQGPNKKVVIAYKLFLT